MITIKADFSLADLEADMNADLEKWFDEISATLLQVGKESIDRQIAKVKPDTDAYGKGFGNITYNLRSSMGCGLVRNGKVIETYFPFGKGDVGQTHGLALLDEIAGTISEGIALIVVAGEQYGVFVEMKGFDVIAMSYARFANEFFNKLD